MLRGVIIFSCGLLLRSGVAWGDPASGAPPSTGRTRSGWCDWKGYVGHPVVPPLTGRRLALDQAIDAVRDKFRALGVDEKFLPKIRFSPKTDAPTIVLIHGISESPAGVAELADAYHAQGYTVYSVLLSGHGLTPDAMKKATPEMWQKEVKEAIDLASTLGNKVVVGGYSMGGTLAIDAAYQYRNQVSGLVLHSPVLRFTNKLEVNMAGREYEGKEYTIDFDPEHPPNTWDGQRYSLTPLKALLNFMEFTRKVETRWEREAPLDIPIYIAHATKDNIADRGTTAKFMQKENIPENKRLPVNGRHYETAQPHEEKPDFSGVDMLGWIKLMAF